MLCFFFKQKTAYEMRISDWSSDVCSSDLSQEKDDGEGSWIADKRRRNVRGAARRRRVEGEGGANRQRQGRRLARSSRHRPRGSDEGGTLRRGKGHRDRMPVGHEQERADRRDSGSLSLRGGNGRRDRKSTRLNSSH